MSGRELVLIGGMTGVTFLVRYGLFALGPRMAFPPLLQRALRFVPVAVLTAIVVPMVLLPDGAHWQITWRNPWLAGALVTGWIAWRFNHLLAAIGGGMVVYFLFHWTLGA